ncbi:MBOAT, membrane-bound O-acyltransferase family-domain-containing protein [Radiomyces spectabilis]|uniref:MBOAT, membrane-bound O-acyltransferase family-domain-containing protein n=1 Tax=Radiomyces spectabilis TaxID=64574 RepID=UPI0022203065|nr:MBOAT, membrane-bound O-acyltransferase family-domain-containing protein [Radiomyces spectabilis]KAI8384492.1 MBOAT, membrane-bound O-acyltransferase family-domain-containing protein [Radiomyces spectabilis]
MRFITDLLAYATGVPESTLRLLLTIILAYPVAKIYNDTYGRTSTKTAADRNAYVLLTGLGLAFFFNGFSIIHSLITVSVSYGMCYAADQVNNRRLAVAGVWVFNALYLLLGYYYMASEEYDISWTMPQCILCLRLMGFSFDFLDGAQSIKMAGPEKAKNDTEVREGVVRPTADKRSPSSLPLSFDVDTPLRQLPAFQEVMAYCYFPSAFLVGPQFSFSLYRKWLNRAMYTRKSVDLEEQQEKAQITYVWRSVALAFIYLSLQQTVGASYPTSYLTTDAFAALPFYKRMFIFMLSGKFVFNKYLGVWLLTEGACAYFGITYMGDNEEGYSLYGGLANALPGRYETATSIDHVIASFNVNTNYWVKYYVFKRLKFLGNKQISQFAALAFLAIWHGFHPMYFVTFFMEFLTTICEKILRQRVVPLIQPYLQRNEVATYAWKFAAWLACFFTTSYCVIGFDMLLVGKSLRAYSNVWFIGHLIFAAIVAANHFIPKRRVIGKKTM